MLLMVIHLTVYHLNIALLCNFMCAPTLMGSLSLSLLPHGHKKRKESCYWILEHDAIDAGTEYLFHIFVQVKYLGEEVESTPVAGAVSICSPWDLLVSCWT
jgi:hypothetical protein